MGCTSAKPKPPVQATSTALENKSAAANNPAAATAVKGPEAAVVQEDHRQHALFSRGESQAEELPASITAEADATGRDGSKDSASTPAAPATEKKVPPARPVRPEVAAQLKEAESAKTAGDGTRPIVTLTGAESEELGGLGKDVDDVVVSEQSDDEASAPSSAAKSEEPAAPVAVMETGSGAPSATVEERLNKVEAVIYPSAKAALSSKGLQKYAAELEKKGIVEYKDLANLVEDLDDPFWNRMPPFPDRKKMRSLVDEVRVTYGLPPASSTTADSPTAPSEHASDDASQSEPAAVMVGAAAVVSGSEHDAPMTLEPKPAGEGDAAAAAAAAQAAAAVAAVTAAIPPSSPSASEREDGASSPVASPPRQKTETPCDDYETDVYATEFGMCVCGHPKKSHQFAQTNKTPSYAQRQPQSGAKPVAETPKDGSVCSNYTLDVKAVTFGMCVCGHPKAAHGAQSATGVNRFKEMSKGSFNKNSPMPRQGSTVSAEKAPEASAKKAVPPPVPKVVKQSEPAPVPVEPSASAPVAELQQQAEEAVPGEDAPSVTPTEAPESTTATEEQAVEGQATSADVPAETVPSPSEAAQLQPTASEDISLL